MCLPVDDLFPKDNKQFALYLLKERERKKENGSVWYIVNIGQTHLQSVTHSVSTLLPFKEKLHKTSLYLFSFSPCFSGLQSSTNKTNKDVGLHAGQIIRLILLQHGYPLVYSLFPLKRHLPLIHCSFCKTNDNTKLSLNQLCCMQR